MNLIILTGRLGKNPELKQLENIQVCNMSLATYETWKDKDGNKREQTEWHSLQAWGKTAEILSKYFKSGDPITVTGKLTYQKWEKDGVKHEKAVIKIDNFEFLPKSKSQDEKPEVKEEPKEPQHQETVNDLPF